MTNEELREQVDVLEKERMKLEREYHKKDGRYIDKIFRLKMKYITDHQPLELKRFQRIRVTLRVTETTVKQLRNSERKRKNRAHVGSIYRIKGIFNGYSIGDDGQVKPCFYGDVSYAPTDEVVSVELTDNQPDGECSKCLRSKEGLCYMFGGKDQGKRFAVWKITDDMVPCPRYEEVIPGGLWAKKGMVWPERHYEATRVTDKQGRHKYRLFEGAIGGCFCEYEEEYIKRLYTTEVQNYNE